MNLGNHYSVNEGLSVPLIQINLQTSESYSTGQQNHLHGSTEKQAAESAHQSVLLGAKIEYIPILKITYSFEN